MLSPDATNPQAGEPCVPWCTLEELCAAVTTHQGLWVPSSPGDLLAAAIDGDGAAFFGRRGHELPVSSAAAPLTAPTLDGPGGARALLAFTDSARARHYARQRGWNPGVSLPSHTVPWLPVLRRVVAENWAGLLVDVPGHEPFVVSRAIADRVFALLQRDRWARLPEWYVLTSNGGVAVERSAKDGFCVWAFDSIEHASRAIDGFLSRDATVSIASYLTTALVRDLVDAGIGCVHANAGLYDEHRYDWNDLRAMVAAPDAPAEAPVALDALSDPNFTAWALEAWRVAMAANALDQPRTTSSPEGQAIGVMSSVGPSFDEVSSAGPKGSDEGTDVLRAAEGVEADSSIDTSEGGEPLTTSGDGQPTSGADTHDGRATARQISVPSPTPPLDFPAVAGEHSPRDLPPLPRLGRSEDEVMRQIARFGKRFETPYVPQWELIEDLSFNFDLWVLEGSDDPWPEADGDHVLVFADGAHAQRAAAQRPHAVRAERLRGIEVFRWAWARSSETSLALMDVTTSPVRLPAGWPLAALCPLGYEIGDIQKVPAVGVPRLTSLPGVRGLRPEVLRALACGWKQLLGVRRQSEPFTVVRDTGAYLAVCTDADEFFRLSAREPRSDLRPDPVVAAPFDGWLGGGDRWQGVVINPGSTAPIVLELTDLVVLSLWATLRSSPSATEVVHAVGQLQRDGRFSTAGVGRILADLPQLVCCGAPERMATLDGQGLVFSTTSRAAAFFEDLGKSRALSPREIAFPGGATPVTVAAGWRRALLDRLPHGVDRVLVDPTPDGAATVTLDAVGLASARGRLREIFRPRVEIYAEFEASAWLSA